MAAEPSVASSILRTLAANGVTHIFGVPGGPLFGLYAALARQDQVRSVLARHETGAAFMALGYAQARGGLGAACATTGAGGTNALTGVASATSDGVPVLLITAQTASTSFGMGALQDSSGGNWSLDLVDVYRSATKLSTMLTNPAGTHRLARHAVRTALDGRPGAVHLNVPADLLSLPAAGGRDWDWDAPATPVRTAPDPIAVAELAKELVGARRPAILAGQGAKLAHSQEALQQLAEWGGIPVATTIKGKSVFPEDHPLSLGVFGFGGSPAAHEHLLSDDIDLLLVVGSGLGELATYGWNADLFRGRTVCQVDVDPLQIGRHVPVAAGVCGDASTALQQILARLPQLPPAAVSWNTGTPAVPPRYRADQLQEGHDVLRASAVVARLSDLLPADTLIFADNGNCLSWLGQYYVIRPPGEMFVSLNVGSMGYAMGAAIGGKLARPERPVVALVGDAAFAMNGMELHTATEYGVPVIWVVLNNAGNGMVYNVQHLIFDEAYDAMYARAIDVGQVARGLGADTATVTSLDQLDRAVAAALAAGRPYVIDARVDQEEVPWALRGRAATLRAAIADRGTDRDMDHGTDRAQVTGEPR